MEDKPNLNIKPPKFYSQSEGVSKKTHNRWKIYEEDKQKNGIYNSDLYPPFVAIRQETSSFIIIFGTMVMILLMIVIPFLPIEYLYLEIIPILVLYVLFHNRKIINEELNK